MKVKKRVRPTPTYGYRGMARFAARLARALAWHLGYDVARPSRGRLGSHQLLTQACRQGLVRPSDVGLES